MNVSASKQTPQSDSSVVMRALGLSFGAAIALGLARFSYALVLPYMKTDLGWTFAQAGALNTSNAVGYLVGALTFPLLARRFEARHLQLCGCVVTALAMVLAGLTAEFHALLVQRLLCGYFSAVIFVSGGILASHLAAQHPQQSGLVLGLFYGGTGWGIVLSALLVPWSVNATSRSWQNAWFALAAGCVVCTLLVWPTAMRMLAPRGGATGAVADAAAARLSQGSFLLFAYGLFGIGYIGYMTFVIALLRAAGLSGTTITAFYVVLGLATAASSRIWSNLLHRARGGGAFALLCLLLSAATLLLAVTTSLAAAFVSGILFGGTFLSVVGSTTAFVRHNFPAARWAAGISVFTIVFALGQIVGPIIMGSISDGTSLARGFVYSAAILLAAAALALGQRSLGAPGAVLVTPERS